VLVFLQRGETRASLAFRALSNSSFLLSLKSCPDAPKPLAIDGVYVPRSLLHNVKQTSSLSQVSSITSLSLQEEAMVVVPSIEHILQVEPEEYVLCQLGISLLNWYQHPQNARVWLTNWNQPGWMESIRTMESTELDL